MRHPAIHTKRARYDVGFGIAADPASRVAVEYIWPACGSISPLVWVCVPGGGMNRHFYDLEGGDGTFSFARQMAERGFASVLIDPPGIGDSDRPGDGYALTPERLGRILVRTFECIREDLKAGNAAEDLPVIEDLRTVGVGHSMGALLTILGQVGGRLHTALALLGFGLQGMPDHIPFEAQKLAGDTDAVRANLVPLARQMFEVPYPNIGGGGDSDLFGRANAEPDAVKAVAVARAPLLPVPGLMSMLPGNVAREVATLDVPIYLAVGEHDLIEPPADVGADFSASPGVKLQVLPGAGHSFFLFPARTQLFDGLAQWGHGLAV